MESTPKSKAGVPDNRWVGAQDGARRRESQELLRTPGVAFPKFAGRRATAKAIYSESADEDGEVHLSWAVSCQIPVRCRVASLIEDIDYTIPLWLNLVGLTWFALQLLHEGAV